MDLVELEVKRFEFETIIWRIRIELEVFVKMLL